MRPKKLIRCRCLHLDNVETILDGVKMRVAICSRIREASSLFHENLRSILDIHEPSAIFTAYENVAELLAGTQKCDIIFHLLNTSVEDEMDVIDKIRKKYRNSKIILVAESGTYLKEAYKVQPFRYLFLSDSRAEIREALVSAINSNKKRKGLVLEGAGKYYYILLQDILYIEALGDEIGIYTLDGNEYIIRMPLNRMLFLIEDDFIKLNRQKIVHARHIESIKHEEAMLDNNENILISGRERKKAAEKYAEYIYRTKLL